MRGVCWPMSPKIQVKTDITDGKVCKGWWHGILCEAQTLRILMQML